jgi:hypothetical protein
MVIVYLCVCLLVDVHDGLLTATAAANDALCEEMQHLVVAPVAVLP